MKRPFLVYSGILLIALLTMSTMLIYWGNKSVELKEEIFAEDLKVVLDAMTERMERDYYCFDLSSDIALPKMDAFYLNQFPGLESEDSVSFKYQRSDGSEVSFNEMPIMGPGQMHVTFRFEFDDIPEFKNDSSLTDFERWVRQSYSTYINDENGVHLFDSTSIDSLILTSAHSLNSELELAYEISLDNSGEVVYSSNVNEDLMINADVVASLYENDENIPDLTLSVWILNKDLLYGIETWVIYSSFAILILITTLVIYMIVRLYNQQRHLLQTQKDFVHGMTHEFNTPISNIKIVARNLSRSGDQKIKKSAEILEQEGDKLQMGIDLVMTTALIEKDELFLEKKEVDLFELLSSIRERNEMIFNEAGINIDLELPEDRAQSIGDAYHLENAFQNLINNVRKHSKADKLWLKVASDKDFTKIDVVDNGKGIPKFNHKKIFQKFERAVDKQARNGYGLGLYYSRMIFKMHGGNLVLNDSIEGAHFTIYLPK